MIPLALKDSNLSGEPINDRSKKDIVHIIGAIDSLIRLVQDKDRGMTAFQLSNHKCEKLAKSPITYTYDYHNNNYKVHTEHYVGFYEVEGIRIEISPRLFLPENEPKNQQWKLFCHLLAYATGVYLANAAGRWNEHNNQEFSWPWFVALLWRATLERALDSNLIPKAYIRREGNLDAIKGRIDFARHFRKNLVNHVKHCCQFDELSFNVPINRAILCVRLSILFDGQFSS